MIDEDLISIIIPVYNAELYLTKCLESIINQTYQNIEILLIDDGSEDSTIRICEDFALKDERILIIQQKNQGASVARNTGIDKSNGRFIMFVDSDDFINVEICTLLMNKMREDDFDLAACGYRRNFYTKNKQQKKISTVVPDCDDINDLDMFGYQFGRLYGKAIFRCPWGKLFKKEIISRNKIYFPPDIKSGHDIFFNIDYLHISNKRVGIVNKALYDYEAQYGSSLSRKYFINDNDYWVSTRFHHKVMDFCHVNGFNDSMAYVAKSFFKDIFINIEKKLLSSCTFREINTYIKNILKLDEIKDALVHKKFRDKEYQIYRFVIRLNTSVLVLLFATMRMKFKQIVRGN